MPEAASISTGIASRYATAIFELSKETGGLDDLAADVASIKTSLAESADLRALINSPVYSRDDQARAVSAIADKMGISETLKSSLGLMASKRRLFVLPHLADALLGLIAKEKGEVSADVIAAKPLTAEQEAKLAITLKERVGSDVKINMAIDESLIGGLIVKVGSQMIDTSIRSRLAALQNTMKEVG